MGSHQTRKYFYSKGNHPQNEKAPYGMDGNICKLHIQQGVNTQNI